MKMKFRDILAGKTVWRGKPQHQGAVDFGGAMAQGAQRGGPGEGQQPRQLCQDLSRP
jgi:hypothetical protein